MLITMGAHAQQDSLLLKPLPVVDSVEASGEVLQDTLPFGQPNLFLQKSKLDTTVIYSAEDSIRLSMDGRTMTLYGNAKVKYGKIELESETILVDYWKHTITANGNLDSLGRRVGYPIFKDGGQVYETRDIIYNFESQKAKISEVVTKQGDGFMHGEIIYKTADNEVYTVGNAYTTCNLANPHFRIVSRKAKMIPNDKVVTGPFYMEINNVPMPLGFFFGAFPLSQKNASGIIFPKYGEQSDRGFFLKGGGYYFDINEYIKIKLTGDIYSKGAGAAYVNVVYRKRYGFDGSLGLSYTNNSTTQNVESSQRSMDYRFTWSHSPQTKRAGQFRASVNIASTSYTTNNLLPIATDYVTEQLDNSTRKLSSNISYSQAFKGTPISLGMNFNHNQDLVTERIDLVLPSINLKVSRITPFKKISKFEPLEKLTLTYNLDAQNKITNALEGGELGNRIVPFNLENIPSFFENSKRGIKHTASLNTSIKLLKHFIITPSFNYNERWYFERLNWGFDQEGGNVVVLDTLSGFNRSYNFSGSFSLTTRIYGTFVFRNPNSKIKAIRHTINPSIGYNYQPDFSEPQYGFYQHFTQEDGRIEKKSRHTGFIYGGAPNGESSSLSFSIGNSLEMKVGVRGDSLKTRKISLLRSLSISSSYNFAADSFNLANFSISANTSILKSKLQISVSATIDPYQYVSTGTASSESSSGVILERRVNRFVWEKGFELGRLTNLSLTLGTNLSAKGRKKDAEQSDRVLASNLSQRHKIFLMDHPETYVDFDVPWNLRMNYNFTYTRSLGQVEKLVQTLTMSGDFSITKKWKITFRTGYDFEQKDFTRTNVGISRDLHCWTMALNWVPFGLFQSFSFTIRVKSSILKDLKLERIRSESGFFSQ